MNEKAISRASLADLQARKRRGEIIGNPNAPEREMFDRRFWDEAEARVARSETQSVHLKLEKDVFDFFKNGGKGHITRMQDVLKAYVYSHK